jgi:hypothetical protein
MEELKDFEKPTIINFLEMIKHKSVDNMCELTNVDLIIKSWKNDYLKNDVLIHMLKGIIFHACMLEARYTNLYKSKGVYSIEIFEAHELLKKLGVDIPDLPYYK